MIEEKVKNGILARLDELEPDYDKYDEQIQQGFSEPAFFVRQIDGAQEQKLGQRFTRMLMFEIKFFPNPDSLTVKAACQNMASRLYESLVYVVWDGITYKGLRLRHEVIEDVLHFFVSFEVGMMAEKEPVPKMEKIDLEERL